MKFENICKVNALHDELFDLIRQKQLIEDSGKESGLGVTINGKYQDLKFVDAIRPYAVAEIVRRFEDIKTSLRELGVVFNDDTQK